MGSYCLITRTQCICDLPNMDFGWNCKQTNGFCWVLVRIVNKRMTLVGFRVKIRSLVGFCCFGDTEFLLSNNEFGYAHITELPVIAFAQNWNSPYRLL